MKIIYSTDLHGDKFKYNKVLEIAQSTEANMVINGGDMLPKGGHDLFRDQKHFINTFLTDHFKKYEEARIKYMYIPGNDDLRTFDDILILAANKGRFVTYIDSINARYMGYDLRGFSLVCDYPFQLKDRCRMDNADFEFPFQYGQGLYSTPNGWNRIEKWYQYCRSLPTIEDELKAFTVEPKSICVIHGPPSGCRLDICSDYQSVGSKSVLKFIEEKQPLLTLHGHIHESPEMTGQWKVEIGRTTVVQPGQIVKGLVWVEIDIEDDKIVNIQRFTTESK